ncbi:MAG TPA: CHAT domain-containing protein, partial [Isosphaeraceae bacterium]|nr:CHAT domain-containing protein [Isosphaeraceae bacterium]
FASPPEPLMAQRHTLRVLVVADPAEDAPLQGAEAEGIAVAELFERFNALPPAPGRPHVRFKVTRLFGPCRATRTDVLRELSVRPYDVLHYAGHCYFNKEQPSLSGWIFNAKDKEILSANELQRIDRVPRFVFSNACESGITPDRSEDRTAELAPSFAEAFFKQGVANFVCTAWPVGDVAALSFARTLYAELLGLELGSDLKTCARKVAGPAPMYRAMQRARQVVAATGDGRKTWGAYQHYGNPYFQLLQALQSGPC